MKGKIEGAVTVLVTLIVLALMILGSVAVVGGFLYAVWTGEWLGAQIALTGGVAMAVGFLGGMILGDL